MTDPHFAMLEMLCPNCGHRFPALLVESTGFCKCGLDFEFDVKAGIVRWTHDPKYPESGLRDYTIPIPK